MDIQEKHALQKLINEMHDVTGMWSVEQMVAHVWQAAKAQAVPAGFVLVPKKATKKMLDAGYEAHDGFFSNGAVQDVYVAMIEAQEPAND